MVKKVIIINFETESLSYQAFSEIKKLHSSRVIKGEQMAVITHTATEGHQFTIDDFIDFTGNLHSSKDSFIGMLIGFFGGVLPMLLGWFAGSMIGGYKDAKETIAANGIFEYVGKQIKVGETGLILIATEEDNRPLNSLIFQQLHGQIERIDFTEVEQEVQDAQALQEQVKETAKKQWNQRQQEKKE